MAVPEDFTEEDREALEDKLRQQLLMKNAHGPCKRTQCPRCRPVRWGRGQEEGGKTGNEQEEVKWVLEKSVGEGEEEGKEEEAAVVLVVVNEPKKKGKFNGSNSISSEPCRENRVFHKKPVVSSEFVRRRGFLGYEAEERKFVRFVLGAAFHANNASQFLMTKADTFKNLPEHHRGVFEKCPNAVESFMRIADAKGFFWYECKKYKNVPLSQRRTRAVEEVIVDFADLQEEQVQPTNRHVPVVSLVLDIETISNRESGVSDAREHPIGMIACEVVNDLDPTKSERTLFIWGETSKTPKHLENEPMDNGSKTKIVHSKTENSMLLRFASHVLKVDPDFLVGYNSNNFDLPYILNRARILNEPSVFDLSLMKGRAIRMLTVESMSNQQSGPRKKTLFDVPGRTCFDLFPFVMSRLKLRRYRLQDVVAHMDPDLKKGDVDYQDIYKFFHGPLKDRLKLAEYCVLDTHLAARILSDLSGVPTLVAQSQVFRSRPTDVLERGQLARNGRLIRAWTKGEFLIPSIPYRSKIIPPVVESKEKPASLQLINDEDDDDQSHDLLFPPSFILPKKTKSITKRDRYEASPTYMKRWEESSAFEGGYVFEPVQGKHELVACLDFNSLYPSIIRAHNLCHTTFIFSQKHLEDNGLTKDDCRETVDVSSEGEKQTEGHVPDTFLFVRETKKQGVLPRMLNALIDARKRTKKMRDDCTDPRVKKALDAEQDSYKLCANSVYGLLGVRGELENFAAASAVTSYGRFYLKKAQQTVLEKYGHQVDFIYGDTDSVMFSMSKSSSGDLDNARALAQDVAIHLNQSSIYPPPMKIEFEKIFSVMLMEDKKRYAGYSFDSTVGNKSAGKLYERGLETIRRDVPPHVSESLREVLHKMLVLRTSDEELLVYVKNLFTALMLNEVPPEKLKMSKAISRALDDYAGKLPHVTAARALVAKGREIRVGDRIEYIYALPLDMVTSKKLLKSERTLAWQLFNPSEFKVDVDDYFDSLSGPLKRALFYLPPHVLGPVLDKRRYARKDQLGKIIPSLIPFDAPFVLPKPKLPKVAKVASVEPSSPLIPMAASSSLVSYGGSASSMPTSVMSLSTMARLPMMTRLSSFNRVSVMKRLPTPAMQVLWTEAATAAAITKSWESQRSYGTTTMAKNAMRPRLNDHVKDLLKGASLSLSSSLFWFLRRVPR